jgi:hypothetical protein
MVMTRRQSLWLAVVFVGAMSAASLAQEAAPKPDRPASVRPKTTVAVTVEFPGDVEVRYKAVVFTEGMTVFDALSAAAKHARPLKFKHTGSGEFAFLTEIDGVKNEGASGKNWTYKVDGERAKVGMGSMKLKAGAEVLWVFGS